MATVIDLATVFEERRRMLDQVDAAIADVLKLFVPMKRTRRRRQLRLPFEEPAKKIRARRA
jgi:hypothetical protein